MFQIGGSDERRRVLELRCRSANRLDLFRLGSAAEGQHSHARELIASFVGRVNFRPIVNAFGTYDCPTPTIRCRCVIA
jgi:hypothetical protein